MTILLAVGLAWLLAATVVALVIGRAIHLADLRSPRSSGLDLLLLEGHRDLDPARSPGAGRDRLPRTA